MFLFKLDVINWIMFKEVHNNRYRYIRTYIYYSWLDGLLVGALQVIIKITDFLVKKNAKLYEFYFKHFIL